MTLHWQSLSFTYTIRNISPMRSPLNQWYIMFLQPEIWKTTFSTRLCSSWYTETWIFMYMKLETLVSFAYFGTHTEIIHIQNIGQIQCFWGNKYVLSFRFQIDKNAVCILVHETRFFRKRNTIHAQRKIGISINYTIKLTHV